MRRFLSLIAVGLLTVAASAGTAFAESQGQGTEKAAEQSQAGGQSGDAGKSESAPGQQEETQTQSGTQTQTTGTGGGANQSPGPYTSDPDPNAPETPSGNGKSTDNNSKKPCAGCVGKADDKNPPGQYPNGSDSNKGYECDANEGIGQTNPAHTGCVSQPPPPTDGNGGTTTSRQPTPQPTAQPTPEHGAVLGQEAEEEAPEGDVAEDQPEEGGPELVSNPRRVKELPFTGLGLLGMVLLGVAMTALGLRTSRLVAEPAPSTEPATPPSAQAKPVTHARTHSARRKRGALTMLLLFVVSMLMFTG